ncbi:hypothetical protein BC940DRAFT_91904 [Gongronella butleri]|nr:hypothetical protein BC940DRAFT_91904 [Gongronella butleri]
MDLVDAPVPSSLNSEYLSRASLVTRQNHWLAESVPFSAPSSSSLASESTSMTPQAHWPAATSTAVPWDASSSSSSSSSLVHQTKPTKATLPAMRNGNNSSNSNNSGKHASPSPRPAPRGDGGNNSTVFVGGLSARLSENELCQYFAPFGPIAQVRIPPGKGCGFVQFRARSSAEDAIANMNGFQIGHSRIRLAWGRSSLQK